MARDPKSALRSRLQTRFGRLGLAAYSGFGCLWIVVLIGLLATLDQAPMLFPSIGPTLLIFFDTPLAASAAPRSALFGHAAAIAAGWLSLAVFGLLSEASVIAAGVDLARTAAAALSLALTAAATRILRAPHPPSGATTLIVSLGFLTTAAELGIMMASIILATILTWLTNRALGLDPPTWRPAHRQ